jgi:DNA-binding response OmpR family regulator
MTGTPASAGRPSPLLLILEDVSEMREWLRALVTSRYPDWRVRTAGTAIDFHREIERERPTLALMDEVLGPGEDLASLLHVAEASLIPIALMTGMDPMHHNAARLPSGAMRRMIKPHWETGAGVDAFLQDLQEVMVLTVSAPIG